MKSTEHEVAVKKRRVFYIPGYDPIAPRRYRELYRSESKKQAEISGYEVSLKAKSGERYGWNIVGDIEGETTQAEVDVLVWADIVQNSMDAGIFRTYFILLQTAWVYVSTGALFRLMKLRRGPIYAALYPVVLLLGQLLCAILLAGIIATCMQFSLGEFQHSWLPAWGVGLPSGYILLRWFKGIDGKIFAYYLMHDYGFSARWRGAESADLRVRMDEFEAAISQALTQDWDEVLVVGHSSGAHLGVSILADVLRKKEITQKAGHTESQGRGPMLAFMSLGQVVPMVSFLPDAKILRRDLAYVSQHEDLFWLDVSAPGDPCSFALCDPVKTAGIAPKEQRWPLVISAAFTQTLSPALLSTMKRRFFRLHFQYLCAFDRPAAYDYFKITAGPRTLADRFKDHAPTPSRIDVAANTFREVAQ